MDIAQLDDKKRTRARNIIISSSIHISLQKLQAPCNSINQTPLSWSNAQHRHAPSRDLRPPRIAHHLRHQPCRLCLGSQLFNPGFAVDLNRNLGLATALPGAQVRVGA